MINRQSQVDTMNGAAGELRSFSTTNGPLSGTWFINTGGVDGYFSSINAVLSCIITTKAADPQDAALVKQVEIAGAAVYITGLNSVGGQATDETIVYTVMVHGVPK
jgi:hypothetical protein